MSRTPLFAAVKRALARSFHEQGLVVPQTSALTRRRLLRISAAAAGAAALSPVLDWSAYAKQERPKGSVAIIGGGVAGLTAAYRLQAAGATPIVFEASNRWGGRMFTVYDFYKGMFCELGGEFVDTGHEDLQKLGADLGVEMQKLAAEGEGEDLYFFGGKFHTPKDMVDPEKKTGAFLPIAKQIAADADKLTDKHDDWTSYARKLDNMSLKAYLEQFRGKTDDWAIDLLDVAYNIEFGLLTEDQSSLLMVDFIGTDVSKPFAMFGESDEVFRIKGGSSALINALVNALKDKADMRQGFALTELDTKGGKIVASFDTPGGAKSESFDAVILALPFTKLRQVKGLERLQLSPEKLKTHSRARHGAECQSPGRHHIARVAQSRVGPSRAIQRHLLFRSRLPESCGSRAVISRATPASSPTISASNRARPTQARRSTPSAPTSPRCRRRWPQASTHRRLPPGSGADTPTRSAAMRAAKLDSIRPCRMWPPNRLCMDACNLPASIRPASSWAS